MVHADRAGSFKLSLIDGDDAASDDLGHVGTGIDRNDHDRRQRQIQCLAAGRKGIAPVDDHGLNHHRGASEDFDVAIDQSIDDLLNDAQNRIL